MIANDCGNMDTMNVQLISEKANDGYYLDMISVNGVLKQVYVKQGYNLTSCRNRIHQNAHFRGACIECLAGYNGWVLRRHDGDWRRYRTTITRAGVAEKIEHHAYTTKQPYPSGHDAAARAGRQDWHKDTHRLYEEFKVDALSATGLLGHPKAERCFALALRISRPDPNGFTDVFNLLDEISYLVTS